MDKKSMELSEYQLVFAIAGQLFQQAPNSQPRNAEIIMTKFRDAFRREKEVTNVNEWYSLTMDIDKVYKFIEDILMAIPEFRDLNLTQIEFENKVSVDDESRPKYNFVTRYDIATSDSWKSDFIDLTAFMQNIMCNLGFVNRPDCDNCELANTSECATCNINTNFSNKYKKSRNKLNIK